MHPFALSKSSRSPGGSAEEMNRRFDWTRRRRDLLIKLLFALSGTIREWDTFISSDGDVGYLSDLVESPTNSQSFHNFGHAGHAGQSLRSIKQAFGRLEEGKQRLIALIEWFSSDFTTVRHGLNIPIRRRGIPLTKYTAQALFVPRRQRRNSKLGFPLKIHHLGMLQQSTA